MGACVFDRDVGESNGYSLRGPFSENVFGFGCALDQVISSISKAHA